MTNRDEIERLLNQTGRTLEGLTEQYDDISVKKRIREVTGSYRWAGTSALLASHCLHQSDVIELLVGALRDALDKPMQKPLTLQELRELGRDDDAFVWEERRNPDNFVKNLAGALSIMCLDARRDPDMAFAYTYNVSVRAWRTLPTDEEREAATWES